MKAAGVLVVVFAITAACAAAPASAAKFTSEVEPTVLTGEAEETHVFNPGITGAEVKCKKASFAGTAPVVSVSEIRLAPTYSEGTEGGAPLTVAMHGCEYLISMTLVEGHFPFQIACPVGVKIEFSLPLSPCKVMIGPQTKLGVSATNKGTGATRDVTFQFTVQEISYEHTGSCESQATNMTYAGAITLKGFEDKGGTEGPQVGIWVE